MLVKLQEGGGMSANSACKATGERGNMRRALVKLVGPERMTRVLVRLQETEGISERSLQSYRREREYQNSY